jgi:O-antigen/teichoic acid export membrane protein
MSSSRRNWSFLNAPVEESFFWSLTLSILPVVSAFAVSWFIARWAGAAVWGTVSWAMAFATAVLIVGKFGLELGASRLASEYGLRRPGTLRELLRTGMSWRMAFTIPVAGLTLVFAPVIARWFGDSALTGSVRVASAIVVCASVYEFFEHFLIGLNRHATVSKVRSFMLLSRVVFSVGLVIAGLSAVYILGGYCAAWIVAIAVFVWLLLRYLPSASDPESRSALTRRLMTLSVPLAISSASVTVYSQMDKLMLGYFNGVEEVGQYAVARAVTEVSLFPAFAFVMTLRPALAARYSSGELEECAALIKNSIRSSLVFGVLFAAIFAVFAEPLLTTVYSEEFRYAGEIMGVFIWVLVLRSIGALILPALVAAEKTKLYAYLTTFSAVINFFLNLVLIPKYQARGAVVATIISYGFLLLAGLHQTFRVFGVRVDWEGISGAIRTVLAGVVSTLLLWQLLERILPEGSAGPMASGVWMVLWVLVLAGIYALLLWFLRVVRIEDVRTIFENLLRRRRNRK